MMYKNEKGILQINSQFTDVALSGYNIATLKSNYQKNIEENNEVAKKFILNNKRDYNNKIFIQENIKKYDLTRRYEFAHNDRTFSPRIVHKGKFNEKLCLQIYCPERNDENPYELILDFKTKHESNHKKINTVLTFSSSVQKF